MGILSQLNNLTGWEGGLAPALLSRDKTLLGPAHTCLWNKSAGKLTFPTCEAFTVEQFPAALESFKSATDRFL
jgi:hypothetical protein